MIRSVCIKHWFAIDSILHLLSNDSNDVVLTRLGLHSTVEPIIVLMDATFY